MFHWIKYQPVFFYLPSLYSDAPCICIHGLGHMQSVFIPYCILLVVAEYVWYIPGGEWGTLKDWRRFGIHLPVDPVSALAPKVNFEDHLRGCSFPCLFYCCLGPNRHHECMSGAECLFLGHSLGVPKPGKVPCTHVDVLSAIDIGDEQPQLILRLHGKQVNVGLFLSQLWFV